MQNVKPTSIHKSLLVRPDFETSENNFRKLPDEVVLRIIAHLEIDGVAAFGETDKRNRALSADDFQRWFSLGLHPPVPSPAMPSVVVNHRLKKLDTHVRLAIPLLVKYLDIFSTESVSRFSAAFSEFNSRLIEAQYSFKSGYLEDANDALGKAAAFAAKAGVKMPSLSELGMDSLHNDRVCKYVKRAQSHFFSGNFGDAERQLNRAVTYAKEYDITMPSLFDLGMESLYNDCMNEEIEAARYSCARGYRKVTQSRLNRAATYAEKAGVQMPSLLQLGINLF